MKIQNQILVISILLQTTCFAQSKAEKLYKQYYKAKHPKNYNILKKAEDAYEKATLE